MMTKSARGATTSVLDVAVRSSDGADNCMMMRCCILWPEHRFHGHVYTTNLHGDSKRGEGRGGVFANAQGR
jgi:hypothetical protein